MIILNIGLYEFAAILWILILAMSEEVILLMVSLFNCQASELKGQLCALRTSSHRDT